jgi:O-antigen ligase
MAGLLTFVAVVAANVPIVLETLALVGASIICLWLARFVYRQQVWCMCALLIVESSAITAFLPVDENTRFLIRYPLLVLFCLPTMPIFWRSGLLWQGGIRDYAIYLGWGLISVTYSLIPLYSFARISASLMLFTAIVGLVSEVSKIEDIDRLLRLYMIGCGIVLALVAISIIVLPSDVTMAPDEGGMLRFRGVFGSPNQLGELMVATVGAGALYWHSSKGWGRMLIATAMIASIIYAAFADSRSPFIALSVGFGAFALWKYRLRGIALIVIAAALVSVVFQFISPEYLNRGDVSTLTGRTDIWRFEIQKVREHPLIGYGFEVEGQIFQDPRFPLWWGPWEAGPRIGLHNGYLSRAVGLGVPSLIFWLFIFFRPWISLFLRPGDNWGLKKAAILVVLPIMILSAVENTPGDFRDPSGMMLMFLWALAELQRLKTATSEPKLLRFQTTVAQLSRQEAV